MKKAHEAPPLSDPEAFLGYLRSGVGEPALAPGVLLFVLADDDARGHTFLIVDDLPDDPPQHRRVRVMAPLLRQLGAEGVGWYSLVICREGRPHVGGGDLAWHDAVHAVRGDVPRCGGVYVVTPTVAIRVRPPHQQAVSA